jgi:mercuric ion transport protein
MKDTLLIGTGAIGVIVAAVCCATPVLVIALGGVGMTALAAYLDDVLLLVLAASLGLIGYGLYLRRQAGTAGASATSEKRNDLRS